jgi:hypothetical protein
MVRERSDNSARHGRLRCVTHAEGGSAVRIRGAQARIVCRCCFIAAPAIGRIGGPSFTERTGRMKQHEMHDNPSMWSLLASSPFSELRKSEFEKCSA